MAKIQGKTIGIAAGVGVTLFLVIAGLMVLTLVTAGSGAAEQTAAVTPPTQEQITACDYNDWLGKKRDEAEALVKTTGKVARIIHTGDPVTMDFSPDRINVELDQNDVVVKVTCG